MNTITGTGTVFFSRIVTDKFGKTALRYGVAMDGDGALPVKVWFRFGGDSFEPARAKREEKKTYAGARVSFTAAKINSAKTTVFRGLRQMEIEAREPLKFETVEASTYEPEARTVTQFV